MARSSASCSEPERRDRIGVNWKATSPATAQGTAAGRPPLSDLDDLLFFSQGSTSAPLDCGLSQNDPMKEDLVTRLMFLGRGMIVQFPLEGFLSYT